MNSDFIIPAGLFLILLLGGCSEPLTTREIGAAVGTVGGAAVGAQSGVLWGTRAWARPSAARRDSVQVR